MQAGGSFWSAFGVRFGGSNASGIDEILERDNVTLEDLLDHDDVIQECKYMNAQLVDFLSSKQSVEKLVRYVITLPDNTMATARPLSIENNETANDDSSDTATSSASKEPTTASAESEVKEHKSIDTNGLSADAASADSANGSASSDPSADTSNAIGEHKEAADSHAANLHKYPYVASELFACEVVSMLDVLFDNESLLDLLFSFLDHTPPMDPSNASYFRKVMVVLIQRKYDALVKYIQSHHIIDRLVTHIGLYSIMEILIMIGWDDGLGQVNDVEWLYDEQLIPKLVGRLAPQYESATDVHMNAARALVDVVVKCPPTQQNKLISHLQSAPVLAQIFTHMFSGSLSSLTNSMSIIIVLVQRYANRRVELGDGDPSKTDTNGTSPTNDASATTELTPPSNHDELTDEPFVSLLPHLHKIIALLQQSQPKVPVQFGSSEPFGETRMKVVELTLVLLRSRLTVIDNALAEQHVLSLMLDAFFAYPWNNMLHGLVESIVRTVLDSDSAALKKSLFDDGKLVDRFVSAYEMSEAESSARGSGKGRGYRMGYMGHLLRTSMAIEEISRKSDAARVALLGDSAGKWTDFVNTHLEKENDKQKVVAPFVGGEEDPLDTLQFDIQGMGINDKQGHSQHNAMGIDDAFSFNDNDDDQSLSSYDYTQSHHSHHTSNIHIPDPDGDDNDNDENDPHRRRANADEWKGDDFGSNTWDTGDSANWPDFAASSDATAATGEYDRGNNTAATQRDLIKFKVEHDEDDEELVNTGENAAAKSADAFGANTNWGDDDFDADFNAAPPVAADATATTTTSTTAATETVTPSTAAAPPEDDFDAAFPPPTEATST